MTPDAFRTAALALPGAVESAHMNHPDFRVCGKVFASLGYPDGSGAMVKLTPEQQASFVERAPEAFEPCKGAWGRSGCTRIHLPLVHRSLLQTALESAHRNVAAPVKKTPRSQPANPRGRKLPAPNPGRNADSPDSLSRRSR